MKVQSFIIAQFVAWNLVYHHSWRKILQNHMKEKENILNDLYVVRNIYQRSWKSTRKKFINVLIYINVPLVTFPAQPERS